MLIFFIYEFIFCSYKLALSFFNFPMWLLREEAEKELSNHGY
jgi:hypothetical protein